MGRLAAFTSYSLPGDAAPQRTSDNSSNGSICDFIRRIARDLHTQYDLCSYGAVAVMKSLGQYLRAAFLRFRNGAGEDTTGAHDRYLRTGLFWFWICVGILLTFDSYNSYGSGLGAIYFGFYFFIYALWRLGKKFWLGKVQLQDFAVVIYAVLVFVVADLGSESFKRKHEANFAPLFAGLEQYRNTIGRYPDELDYLVPEYVTSIPECPVPSGIYAPESSYRWDATSYGIKCEVGGFLFPNYGMYESEDATWIYNDSGVIY